MIPIAVGQNDLLDRIRRELGDRGQNVLDGRLRPLGVDNRYSITPDDDAGV